MNNIKMRSKKTKQNKKIGTFVKIQLVTRSKYKNNNEQKSAHLVNASIFN